MEKHFQRFRLRSDLTAVPFDSSTLILGEHQRVLVHATLPPEDFSLDDVPETIRLELIKSGLIVPLAEGNLVALPPEQAAFWESMGVHAAVAARRLSQCTVNVSGANRSHCAFLVGVANESGITITPNAELTLELASDYLATHLIARHDSSLLDRRPWIPAKLSGRQAWIGPVVRPGRSACWACLRHRLIQNRWADTELFQHRIRIPNLSRAASPPLWRTAACLLIQEVLNLFVKQETRLDGHLLTLDTATQKVELHPVERRLDCPVCSKLGRAKLWRSSLSSSPPDLAHVHHRHHSHLTGFFAGLRALPRAADMPFFVWTASVTPPLNLRAPLGIRSPIVVVGSHEDDGFSRAACIGEAVERYSLHARGTEPCVQARWTTLRDGRAIDPGLLWNYSKAQFAACEIWNALGEPHCAVPMPLEATHAIEWLRARNLTSPELDTWIPAAYVLLGYADYDASFASADSTGTAAAPSLEEAVMRGLLEVVERDAAALWWYNRIGRPALAVEVPRAGEVQRWLTTLNRQIWFLDLTTEWNVPVVAAVSARNNGSAVLTATASGTTLADAGERAVRELAVAVYFEGRQTGLKQHWLQTETVAKNPWLHAQPTAKATKGDNVVDLNDLLNRARRLGWEVLAVDLTRSSTGALPVAKVCVPGMCSAVRRTGPGRLYQAPFALDWLQSPLEEDQLNPWPLML